jgi:hypothetical protein
MQSTTKLRSLRRLPQKYDRYENHGISSHNLELGLLLVALGKLKDLALTVQQHVTDRE